MLEDDNPEQQSLITLDRLMFARRRRLGLSQREFAVELSDKVHQIDYITYSQIENARIDVRVSDWDWLIPRLAKWLQIDLHWLESIRQQTPVVPITESPAFITYARKREK